MPDPKTRSYVIRVAANRILSEYAYISQRRLEGFIGRNFDERFIRKSVFVALVDVIPWLDSDSEGQDSLRALKERLECELWP